MPRSARQTRDALTRLGRFSKGTRLLEQILWSLLILASVAGGLLLSGWFYDVQGRKVEFAPDAIVTPLGRFTFDRGAKVVRAETKVGRIDFDAKGQVSILAVPSAKPDLLQEIASLHVNLTDILPAYRDARLTLTIGLRSGSRFLPLLAISQRRVSDVGHGEPLGLTTLRALRLVREINDVAMEVRASFIEAFRAMGLTVHFDENV